MWKRIQSVMLLALKMSNFMIRLAYNDLKIYMSIFLKNTSQKQNRLYNILSKQMEEKLFLYTKYLVLCLDVCHTPQYFIFTKEYRTSKISILCILSYR